MSLSRLALGRRGERAAARFLKRRGYRVLKRNWRCPAGEIDLVCSEGEVLVFVEVKSRSTSEYLPPEAALSPKKRRKLERLALYYMACRGLEGLEWRVDAVSVVLGRWPRASLSLFRGIL